MTPAGPMGVVITAAGQSRRMNGRDKIFTPVDGAPLLAHSLRAYASLAQVAGIALVLPPDRLSEGRDVAERYGGGKVTAVVPGGRRRQDSVRAGLEALGPCPWVAVHDGARPLVDAETILRGLQAVQETDAAVCAVPAKDTIKVADADGTVIDTPPRDRLWLVQTPQIFRRDLLMDAHRRCRGDFTDDSSMVESLGAVVKLFMGSYENIKVTTPEDLALVEALLRRRKAAAPAP